MQLASTTSCRHLRMGRGCEAAALTAELLTVAFLNSEMVEEVYQVLSLTDAHLDPDSWVPKWFLSLADPTSICPFRLACLLSSRGEGVGIWHRAGSMSVWTNVCIHSRGSWLASCSCRECQRSSNVIANKLATSSWTAYLKRPAASRFWASQQSTPWCRDAARCWVLWINQSLKTFEKAFVYLLQCDLFAGCFYSFADRGIKPGNIRKLFACGFAAFWSCTNLY